MKKFINACFIIPPLLILGILIFLSCTNNPNNPIDEHVISGKIVDEQNNPVPFAIIDIYSTTSSIAVELAKDTTDEDGSYLINKLPDDISNLVVRITHPDFQTFEENLTSFKSKNKTPFILCHEDTCNGAVSLFTFNDKDSSALSDVEVRLFRTGSLIRKALTKDGKLIFTKVCPGMYILRLYKPGFGLIYDSTYVNGNDSIPLPLNYFMAQTDTCCHGLIGITVKDSVNGNVIEGASVYLWSGSMQSGFSKTDENGNVLFTDICEGDFTIKIVKEGYNYIYITTLHMNCNDTNFSTQYMVKKTSSDSCCTAVLISKVTDAKDSSAIEDATVYVLMPDGKKIQGTTDNNGIFTATGLCAPATYTVKAFKDGYNYQYMQLIYIRCDTVTMKIPLTKKSDSDSCCHGIVDVTVIDSSTGNNLKGVSVALYLGSSKIGIYNSDANGHVLFNNICPGDYTLKMQKDGYNMKYVNLSMKCNDTNISTQYLSGNKQNDSCCTAKINVTVLDSADNSPIEGTTVYIFRTGSQTIQGTTGSNGEFSAVNLCAPAAYTVKVTKSGYSYMYTNVQYTICDTKNLTITLMKK
ncbi:MAG: carboxypeptidase regulatory-like domain-containing protein [Ignavibacteriae bacterium]|nr:carboxypeptidase regulatory-like domain-containing protein [Ignavibacteriota bacterium]